MGLKCTLLLLISLFPALTCNVIIMLSYNYFYHFCNNLFCNLSFWRFLRYWNALIPLHNEKKKRSSDCIKIEKKDNFSYQISDLQLPKSLKKDDIDIFTSFVIKTIISQINYLCLRRHNYLQIL